MKFFCELSVLVIFLSKADILVLDGAIPMKILQIFNWIETLIKKIAPDSSYLRLINVETEIGFSGLPIKALEGFHISEGAG